MRIWDVDPRLLCRQHLLGEHREHRSPLDASLATGLDRQDTFVDPPDRQRQILRAKPCDCLLTTPGIGT